MQRGSRMRPAEGRAWGPLYRRRVASNAHNVEHAVVAVWTWCYSPAMARAPSVRRDRQVVRILGLLKVLAEGGRPTVYELAARFKARRETIYRDLHALEEIGYPIVGDEAGRLSRPRLAPDFHPAALPVALTRKEVAALVWAVKEAGARQPLPRGALERPAQAPGSRVGQGGTAGRGA